MASQLQVGESRTNVRNDWRRYAAVKLSTEYDSEGAVFVNKLSARMLNGLAKLTGSVQREPAGDFRYPLFGVVTKYLSVLYDHEDKNALVTVSADIGRNLQVKYLRDVKAQQGEVKLLGQTSNMKYKTQLAYDIPPSTTFVSLATAPWPNLCHLSSIPPSALFQALAFSFSHVEKKIVFQLPSN
jgi:hypothetical protein